MHRPATESLEKGGQIAGKSCVVLRVAFLWFANFWCFGVSDFMKKKKKDVFLVLWCVVLWGGSLKKILGLLGQADC